LNIESRLALGNIVESFRLDPKAFLFIALRSEARFPAFLSGSVGLLVL